MFQPWFSPAFALEAQQVMWLRTLRIMAGGPKATQEAFDMVAEKVLEAQHVFGRAMLGASPDKIAKSYRKKVRANLRRLRRT